jgi:hypothetical protein
MKKRFLSSLLTTLLILCLSVPLLADTIHLKDGSVIRGQVIGFRDQQFTVLVGQGSRGRRSQITIYMEDVESIEFEAVNASLPADTNTGSTTSNTTRPQPSRPAPTDNSQGGASVPTQPVNRPPTTSSPAFFQINTRVRGDNTANGWTNTGLVVRRGQRLRISATGRVTLGEGVGRVSTPAGLPTLPDRDKLMRTEATGGLIAVIGDDNDEFIFIGRNREFTAQRDGVLFLGVNEGNLNDNTGAYDAVIEAEALGSTSQR